MSERGGGTQAEMEGKEAGGCTQSLWFGRKGAIYHVGAALTYKLFRLLEIYILYNYFGSIVSDESHSSQVNALN